MCWGKNIFRHNNFCLLLCAVLLLLSLHIGSSSLLGTGGVVSTTT